MISIQNWYAASLSPIIGLLVLYVSDHAVRKKKTGSAGDMNFKGENEIFA